MWWLLVAVVLCCSTGIFLLLRKFARVQKESDLFFRETERIFGLGSPTDAMEQYDTIRQELYDKWRAATAKGADCDAESEADDPEKSWQRQLPPQIKAQLKSSLVKRAMGNIPRYSRINKEWASKQFLYKNRLLSERHWRMFDQSQSDLGDEIEFIRYEAECVQAGWGIGDKVLEDAAVIFRYQQEKLIREAVEKSKDEEVRKAIESSGLLKNPAPIGKDAPGNENEIKNSPANETPHAGVGHRRRMHK